MLLCVAGLRLSASYGADKVTSFGKNFFTAAVVMAFVRYVNRRVNYSIITPITAHI